MQVKTGIVTVLSEATTDGYHHTLTNGMDKYLLLISSFADAVSSRITC